jgi:hypothetical protein
MKKITGYLAIASAFSPFVAFASTKTLNDLVGTFAVYLNDALALLMGFAIVCFVWYVIQYFIQPSETSRTEGSKYVMWSVIGFFVIFSIWGLVNILISTFNLGQNAPGSWVSMSNLFPQ